MVSKLIEKIQKTKAPICVGLDPMLGYIPEHVKEKAFAEFGETLEGAAEAIWQFNCAIVDATADLIPAVKPQIAMYEQFGIEGLKAYDRTVKYCQQKGLIVIGDIKRGDIGSTSAAYATGHLGSVKVGNTTCSAFNTEYVTVNPYLGTDGVKPFVDECNASDRGIFVLVKTSNPSSGEFQDRLVDGRPLYELVAEKVVEWGEASMDGDYSNVGAVVGATYPEMSKILRKLMPKTYFLVPGYGAQGGTAEDLMKVPESITGAYLSGKKQIPVPAKRRKPTGYLKVVGAQENNLKNIDVKFPLGVMTCVTGVSGSGKSSLVNQILYKRLARDLNRARTIPGKHKRIEGLEQVDKVINIDQSPIGRTPRSNPATYTGVFDLIRDLFAGTPDAKARGYKKGRFSFNVKGGRCEACAGDGILKIEMHFLPDVYVPCEVCGGKRYNRETLEVRYKGKNIYDVLNMTVEEAVDFFENVPSIRRKMETLRDVGLSYIRLGQPSTELSGGEAQRIKLATELSKRSTGKTVYILDEPTTGLHFADVHKLTEILRRLSGDGNTVIVIEHNLDVIKTADYIIDIGPEGGDRGGTVVASGTPEEVAKNPDSYTGKYIASILEK